MALVPDDPDALTARARAFEALQQFWDMVDDLNVVLGVRPSDVDALVMRGAGYRKLDTLELALEDLDHALVLQPTHGEGLLERGTVYRLQGNTLAARTDWRLLIKTQPKSEAGKKAAVDLHSMDSGVDISTGEAR